MTRVIEADETGRMVLTPEMLGEARPHGRYVVEENGTKIDIYPENASAAEKNQMTSEEWETHWKLVQQEMAKVWPEGVSAADVISEMRR